MNSIQSYYTTSDTFSKCHLKLQLTFETDAQIILSFGYDLIKDTYINL